MREVSTETRREWSSFAKGADGSMIQKDVSRRRKHVVQTSPQHSTRYLSLIHRRRDGQV